MLNDTEDLRQLPSRTPFRRTSDGAVPATGGIPVAPGDLVRFPDGRRRRVTTTFACHDPAGSARWWWSFLEDGTILDQAETGDWHHVGHEVLPMGATFARELVGPNGYLQDFEAQVRTNIGVPAVAVPFAGRTWRVATTGLVVARRSGEPAPLPGWATLGHGLHGVADVWFALDQQTTKTPRADQGYSQPGHAVIGIWTDHVALATGRRILPRRSRARLPHVQG